MSDKQTNINTSKIKSSIKNIQSGKKNARSLFITIIAVFLVVIIFKSTVTVLSDFPRLDSDTYQAVFLTNNQVYFGKLKNLNSEYAVLENIYYLRASTQLQQGADSNTQQPAINLVKFGNELHGPEDNMFIAKDKIIFWENLRQDSAVIVLINRQQEENQQQEGDSE